MYFSHLRNYVTITINNHVLNHNSQPILPSTHLWAQPAHSPAHNGQASLGCAHIPGGVTAACPVSPLPCIRNWRYHRRSDIATKGCAGCGELVWAGWAWLGCDLQDRWAVVSTTPRCRSNKRHVHTEAPENKDERKTMKSVRCCFNQKKSKLWHQWHELFKACHWPFLEYFSYSCGPALMVGGTSLSQRNTSAILYHFNEKSPFSSTWPTWHEHDQMMTLQHYSFIPEIFHL